MAKKIAPVSPNLKRARIMGEIQKLRDRDPEAVRRFEAIQGKYDKQFQALFDAIEDSERLSAADYAITINAR